MNYLSFLHPILLFFIPFLLFVNLFLTFQLSYHNSFLPNTIFYSLLCRQHISDFTTIPSFLPSLQKILPPSFLSACCLRELMNVLLDLWCVWKDCAAAPDPDHEPPASLNNLSSVQEDGWRRRRRRRRGRGIGPGGVCRASFLAGGVGFFVIGPWRLL